MSETKLFPVLWQSLTTRERDDLKRLGCPRSVPWSFVAPHEEQALRNHDQTLTRLAERGGLSPAELLAVVEGKRFRDMEPTDAAAVPRLLALLERAGA